MFTTTWRNKIQAFELSTSEWVQERPSEVLGAEHVRWMKSSDPDSEAAGPRVNGWIDGWTDAKATAEQVKRERSSLTCQNDVYCGWGQGERHDIIMLANRGSQCQSNLQPENTWLRKAMNMIRPSNRCSHTSFRENLCIQVLRKWGNTADFPSVHLREPSCSVFEVWLLVTMYSVLLFYSFLIELAMKPT